MKLWAFKYAAQNLPLKAWINLLSVGLAVDQKTYPRIFRLTPGRRAESTGGLGWTQLPIGSACRRRMATGVGPACVRTGGDP